MTDLDDRAYLEHFPTEPVNSDPRIARIKSMRAQGMTTDQINLMFRREKEERERRLTERRKNRRRVVRRGG
jgi:hypothetical protein